MKFLVIAYNESIDDEVMSALSVVGSECCYTKWRKVLGRGRKSGPHLDSHVWPKANNVLAVALEDDQCRALMKEVYRLRAELGHHGIKAFQFPLEEMT